MPTDIQFKNDARSTLDGAISAAATSLAVQSGEGLLFPVLTGSQYFYFTLQDAAGNREICKCTVRHGDDFLTIVRAQEGTSALAFASGDKVELRVTAQGLQDKLDQELWDSLVQAAMPTLVKDSAEYLALTPTAAGTLALPTTDVRQGKRFVLVNLATDTAYGIRVNASGGAQVTYAPAAAVSPIPVMVMALQDAPTLAAHWAVLEPPRGIIAAGHTQIAIPGGGADTFASIPADLVYKDGMVLRLKMALTGPTAGSANWKFTFGTTDLKTGMAIGAVGEWARFELEIHRRGAASGFADLRFYYNSGSVTWSAGDVALTEDFTTILDLIADETGGAREFQIETFALELL